MFGPVPDHLQMKTFICLFIYSFDKSERWPLNYSGMNNLRSLKDEQVLC